MVRHPDQQRWGPPHVARMNAWDVLVRGRGVRDTRGSGRVVAPKPSAVRWEAVFPLTCSCLTGNRR